MGVISAEYRDRIGHWIRTLKNDFYSPIGVIELECCRTQLTARQMGEGATAEHLTLEEAKQQIFTPVSPGYQWGSIYEYAWFRGKIRLTGEMEGKRCVMNLAPGGESTLFVNDKEFGTYRADWVHEPHHFMEDNFLTDSGREGDCYELYMETYAGHYYPEAPEGGCATGPVLPGSYEDPAVEGSRRTLGTCTFGIWDEDAYQLYMDVMTLNDLLNVVDEDSLRGERIAEALEDFTRVVDFEQEKSRRSQDYRDGRLALKPVMEAVNGSTMPQFYAIGNAHLDLAWLWPMAETKRKTARTFAAQLRLIKEYKDYRFIQSQPAAYEMCREAYPELFEEIRQAVKDGQWIAEGAMWVEPDTNMAGGEALIRQLLYGKRYYKEMFDVDSRLLWLPDTFGYTAALPQILKGCGVDYLVTQKIFWSYNGGEQFPYHYFNWRGMDGSEVTSFLPTSYTYPTNPAELNRVWKNRVQKRDLDTFLYPFGYGDGGGGPARDHIEYLERQKNLEGGVKVRMESPVEYFKEMDERGGPVNTYTGELYFTAHRGTYTTQAAIKKGNRRAELSLRELEVWGTAAETMVGEPYSREEGEKLWKETLLNQFHDILPGSSIGRVYQEAEQSLLSVIEKASEGARHYAEQLVKEGEGITLFNSLSFPRTVLVDVPKAYVDGCRTLEGAAISVYDTGDGGKALVAMPAMGAISIVPVKMIDIPVVEAAANAPGATQNSEDSQSSVQKVRLPLASVKKISDMYDREKSGLTDGYLMENDYLSIQVNHQGEITSYVVKSSGREFASAPMNHFRMFKDVPRKFDAWDIDSNYREQEVEGAFEVHVEIESAGGPEAVLKVQGRLGESTFTQLISLTADGRRVEFQTEVDWHELHRLLKVSFPAAVYTENGINEMQFGYVERPMHRSRAYDKDRFEVCNHRYSAVCDGGSGFAVLNDCKYGIGMEDGVLELTLLRGAACPEMRADNRIHHFTYGAAAWMGTFQGCDVVRQGYEMNVKPLIVPGIMRSFSMVEISEDNIILDSMKLAEDESGDVILRLYESKKQRTTAHIRMDWPMEQVFECDMLENIKETAAMQDKAVVLDMKAFDIKTLRIHSGNLKKCNSSDGSSS